jgi:hypothetical protein
MALVTCKTCGFRYQSNLEGRACSHAGAEPMNDRVSRGIPGTAPTRKEAPIEAIAEYWLNCENNPKKGI